MEHCQHMRVPTSCIPQEVWDDPSYDIHIANDGYIYLEIRRGLCGLKEAGILAFNQLVKMPAPHGYKPMPFTPGLWRHRTKRTTFALCVDDFGVKCFSKADAQHLIDALKADYKLTINWAGALCCGLTLDWHCDKGCVDVSMPGYLPRALKQFDRPTPLQPQHALHKWLAPVCGSCMPQTATTESQSTPLEPDSTTRMLQISGAFLCCSNVNCCILPALYKISSKQSTPTTDTNNSSNWLMDHLHTCPNAAISFHASDMILKTTVDAACLVLPKARSRAAAHCHLGWYDNNRGNGAIDVLCTTIKNVFSSASEACGIYQGGRHACPILSIFEALGHKQPTTGSPLKTNNRIAHGILNSKMRQKLSKSFDMQCWWMKDQICQGQFNLLWAPRKFNFANYFTKHHPPCHHRRMRHRYLQKHNALSARGCVSPLRQVPPRGTNSAATSFQ
jgi:hypothetical protein